jgi:circadian clock protein KaiC
VSAIKSRISAHERSIREIKLGPDGLQIGEALTDFEGVLSGVPSYRGAISMLQSMPPPKSER